MSKPRLFTTSKRLLALSLSGLCVVAMGVCTHTAAWPGKAAHSTPEPKNFLPPVALINGSINPEEAEKPATNADQAVEAIAFSAVNTPGLKLNPRLKSLSSQIPLQNTNQEIQTVFDLQQKLDESDLRHLWEATVEKNPVIRFSLEKLATPVDLHQKKSSQFLNKTLSTMLSGAAMGMMMVPGGSMYQNMGVMSVTQAAQNMITGNNQPVGEVLSATEQIQLAGLIDDLKSELIQSYHNYKKTLELLAQAHEVSIRNNNLYSKALSSKGSTGDSNIAKMAAGSAFYKAMLNETSLRQKAMLYRLKLERLAGTDAVGKLQLALFVTPETPDTAVSSTSSTSATLVSPRVSPETNTTNRLPKELKPLDNMNSPAASDNEALEQAVGPPVPALTTRPTELPNELPDEDTAETNGPPLPDATPDKL